MRISLINILMHLRLVSVIILIYSISKEYEEEGEVFENEIVKSSNKFENLLSKMIPKLLNEGHKILIFLLSLF